MELKNKIRHHSPEILLLIIVIFYWCTTSINNPVAIGLFVALVIQIFAQARLFGKMLAVLFSVLAFWMILAFVSDAIKINDFSKEKIFLISAVTFCLAFMIGSILMLRKYFDFSVPFNERIRE